jgi:hypothetical protein
MKDDVVRPLGDEKRHYWLALGMAQASGADLQRALEEGASPMATGPTW